MNINPKRDWLPRIQGGNLVIFSWYFWQWGFWFRLFGRGLWIAINDNQPLLFSERYGFRRIWRFAGIKIKWLCKRQQMNTNPKKLEGETSFNYKIRRDAVNRAIKASLRGKKIKFTEKELRKLWENNSVSKFELINIALEQKK